MPRGLAEYRRKRRFDETPEPSGDGAATNAQGGRFVVQEHHARRLHWDLRLERDGVLVSWAIPNGIPDDPSRNRKAVHVEDHPLEYIDFHGTIPSGYGAGEVTIWDAGTYACEKWLPRRVVVAFDGERLSGRYALFQTGRSDKDWMIHRMDPPVDATAEETPANVSPMLARLSTLPRDEANWSFEVKWDGVRALAHSRPGHLSFITRNGNDVAAAYPELRPLNRALGSHAAILDGEIVAFDEDGKPSFQALQPRIHLRGASVVRRQAAENPVTYAIFDLLWLDGHSLMDLPYTERRERLAALRLDGERWRVPDHHPGQGSALLAATREQGVEGVVAKRLDSRYAPGRRDGSWLKIKNSHRQELVIGGWTEGRRARQGRLGALELGVYDPDSGDLTYAGRVGTGFDEAELDRLAELLKPLARRSSPFSGRQPARGARFVKPTLVCEVEFGEWTRDGRLRHPRYEGLRDDKPAVEVVRERVQPPPRRTPSPASRAAGAAGDAHDLDDLDALVAAGRTVRNGVEVELEGRTLRLTNLDKILYPDAGFTKGDLIRYSMDIAPVLLGHLRDHPLTLKRYPNGVEGEHFYEKQSPRHRPEWVQTVSVYSRHSRRDIHYTLCQDLPTLVWLANLADIELHPSLSKADEIERPATLAFDLDPGPPATIVECCEVALALRALFQQLGLRAFPKTSGSKGMQIYVPLNDPAARYEQTKPFAHAVAALFEQRRPELVVSDMRRKGGERSGKVLIDWSQNDEHKTTISVYSLRAKERPTVSTPLAWTEVEACLRRADPDLLRFEHDAVRRRVADKGDLFAEVLSLRQRLPALRGLDA
ncbi:MAG TPA: DNA ligase D [Conexibacter sp.]|nr:DNA ligase D [Conexibacter sp.]